MGRIKDTIVKSPADTWGGLVATPLVTRNGGGPFGSLLLLASACAKIVRGRLDGSLALVHVNMGDRGSAVRKGLIVLVARMVGTPTFLHLHAATPERDIARLPRLARPLLMLPFRAATCIIVLGDRWKQWLQHDMHVTDTPIEVLVNGVPVDPPTARSHAAPIDRPLNLLFLGNLIPRKGIDDLIDALTRLSPDGPAWTATLAGNGDIARYRSTIADVGLGDRVRLAGWVDHAQAQQLLNDADLMVLPSYDEGLPLVVLEALGLGTPVITTPVGAMPEFLSSNDNVIFVAPGDRPALAAAIDRIFGDAVKRQALSDSGIAAFQRQFSVAAFRSSLAEIWRRYL